MRTSVALCVVYCECWGWTERNWGQRTGNRLLDEQEREVWEMGVWRPRRSSGGFWMEEEKGLMPQAERVERQRRKGIRGTEGQGREAGSWFAGRGKRSPRFH